jgi:hypothetical protein
VQLSREDWADGVNRAAPMPAAASPRHSASMFFQR